ncbi:cytidylyltransferase domain-containing protein [Pseudodesulfovibrio senegalensis]|uniref:Acylneuraminate cytidylyltransferase family protein n=1 Tax=Pseudodesulfovibrio senegalensis TaxID=1721087 RepID=A0A6N6N1V9_9BACT|nr:hypothetical protein [Pseudodesulfovibrio senegalensis]KAB1441395.1 hypothetical protein F8A88_10635 [Pseudodesulfovibrio senegalensis]
MKKQRPFVRRPQDWCQKIVDRYFPGTLKSISDEIKRSGRKCDKTVIHIAARSGSSRLKDKNIKPLCGIPLMGYTIAIARSMGADRILVNTDSAEYAKTAERYGAEIPFLRPPELATDKVSPGIATYYAQKWLLQQEYPVKTWIELYPTSPFRNAIKMQKYLKKAKKSGSFFTVAVPQTSFDNIYDENMCQRSSNAEPNENHNIFFKRIGNMTGHDLVLSNLHWRHCQIINDPVELIDIDTESDFEKATKIIDSGCYNFGVPIC